MSLIKVLSKQYYSKDSTRTICVSAFDSPVGKIIAAADDDFLYLISFEDSKNIEKMLLAEVWQKLQEVPYGSLQTYGDLAEALGRGSSHSRAIGAACGANPLLLLVPCHRIVASGSKGGFSSGMDRKEWLIEHEKKNTA